MRRVLIIGAGAAGLMAAIFAARTGTEVTVLERNEKPGKKIYLTGKGRCNVTNDCAKEDFLREVPRNPRFLHSALSFFSPEDMKNLLAENGCPTVTQRGRRVFPATEKASDVTRALVRAARERGADILLNQRVKRLLTGEDGRIIGAETEDGIKRTADAVILATGGVSYPATGSTGDGYRFAAEAGHTILPLVPSLIGLDSNETWPRELQGLSLKNVRITLKKGNKVLYSELGEMLFTHFGFSGPLILEASCYLPEEIAGCVLELDLKPGLTQEQLDVRLRRDLEAGSRKQIRNILPGLMPASLAELFPALCGLPAVLPCNQMTASQRESLIKRMKALPLDIGGRRPIAEAVITRGGVSVKEVNPGTMESKKTPGLYFAGEILDVDAHTGGYNLQIAFSTGALAGSSAGTEDKQSE